MTKRLLIAFSILTLCFLTSCASGGAVTQGGEADSDTDAGVEAVIPTGKGDAVFVDGSEGDDENDGLTDVSAVKSFERAYGLLSENRSKIVVVRSVKTSLNYSCPEYGGRVVITSVYDGVDYAEKNGACLTMGYSLSFNSDTTLENIEIMPVGAASKLCFNFHNGEIGENVEVPNSASRNVYLVAGYNVADKPLTAEGHVTAKQVSYNGDCTLAVNSGKWHAVIGGNYRNGYHSPMGTFDGNMTLNIGGSAEVLSGAKADDVEGLGVSAAGHNISKGSVTLNINGGVFKCPVYAVGKVGRYYNNNSENGKKGTDGTQFGKDVRYEADVTVNVKAGDFTEGSVLNVLQAPGDTALHGDYSLNVTGGSFKDGFTFSGFGIVGKSKAEGIGEKSAVAFDELNGKATGAKKPLRIACCGDSITFGTCAAAEVTGGYTYAKENFFYPNAMQKLYGTEAVVGNFGYPGSALGSGYNKYYCSSVYNAMTEFDPDVILLALGTNNASGMPGSKDAFLSYYRGMLGDMHKRFPNAKIIMTTAIYRWDSAQRTEQVEQYIIPLQKQLADQYDYITLYDAYTEYKPYGTTQYYKDKLHPNNLGYQKLAEVMKKGVDQVVNAD